MIEMDPYSEGRLGAVNQILAEKVRRMAEMLRIQGLEIRVTQGLRSWNEQAALYAQGRTAPGNKVTNAPAGYSWHNFGLAVDCAPDDPTKAGYQIDWNAGHPQWKQMEDAGRTVGLYAGADFLRLVDAPHFQLTGRFPISPDDEVRQLFKDGGMQAVWEEAKLNG